MTLVDVNLLVYAANRHDPKHEQAEAWLGGLLQRGEPVGLPWIVLIGFVRVVTNQRILNPPLAVSQATKIIEDWLAQPSVTVPSPTHMHFQHFSTCCTAANAIGNLVTDAHLAALVIEHGAELASNDADFARFPGLRWFNPLADVA